VPSTALRVAIDEVASRDAVVSDLVTRIGPISHRPRDPDGPFGALVRAIVFQQLAGRPAQAIQGRVRTAVGESLTPETLNATSDQALRTAGLSANKLASSRATSRYGALDSRTTARRAPLRLFSRRTPEAGSLGEIKPGARRQGVDLR